ncbi:MAG: ATP-binding protein [Actinomycetes bacterium]
MTLTARIAVATAGAVALALLLVGVGVYASTARTLLRTVDRDLAASVAPLVDRGGPVRPRDLPRVFEGERRFGPRRGDDGVGGVQLVTAAGDVRTAGAGFPVGDVGREVADGGRRRGVETVQGDDGPVRVLSVAVGDGVAVQVGRGIGDVAASLETLRSRLVRAGLLGTLLAAGLGALVARRAVGPVRTLTDAAEDVARTQDLTRRIEVAGEDELARLAASFNAMLASLDQARRAQQQLVADASHELRTPLTSLRTNIEVLQLGGELDQGDRDRLLADVVAQLDEFGRLVTGLVELTRGERPALDPTPVRLDELVASVVARAATNAPAVELRLDAEPVTVLAERDRLERAVANLVDNAVKYAGDAGPVEVTVAADGTVAVRDHGPGVAPEDAAKVFDRFYRAPATRGAPGSGLGLSIVAQVAAAHGGRVHLEHPEGGGARFVLRLPRHG